MEHINIFIIGAILAVLGMTIFQALSSPRADYQLRDCGDEIFANYPIRDLPARCLPYYQSR